MVSTMRSGQLRWWARLLHIPARVPTERARLCDDAMGLGSLLLATLLGVAGRVGSVLASQSSRISKRVTGTQSLSISAKLMVGKRNTQASRMYVPAHVGCTL